MEKRIRRCLSNITFKNLVLDHQDFAILLLPILKSNFQNIFNINRHIFCEKKKKNVAFTKIILTAKQLELNILALEVTKMRYKN